MLKKIINNLLQVKILLIFNIVIFIAKFIFSYKVYNPEFNSKSMVSKGDINLFNVKNDYDEPYLEYYLLILE